MKLKIFTQQAQEKKMEPVFVKHYAPNICLPLREGHILEETL